LKRNLSEEFHPKQIECLSALSNNSPFIQVLYGGAAGGGKSRLGVHWQIMRRLKYPGTRGLIGRSKLATLQITTLRSFFEVAQHLKLVAGKHYHYNGQSHIITFSNGSEIILKDLFAYPSDPNFDSLGSLELTDAFIDEVSQVTHKAVTIVQSRLRFKLVEFDLKPKMLMTCNPSKGWLYNDFYQPSIQGTLPDHKCFIAALPSDNPSLPASYYDNLSLLPEIDRQRLLEGNWDYDESNDRIYQYDDLLTCFRDEKVGGNEKYITADIARYGKDRTVICYWQGCTLIEVKLLVKKSIVEVVAAIREIIAAHGVTLSNVVVDEDGIGGGVVDTLKCRGFLNGSRAVHAEKFTNIKAEAYFKLGELIEKNAITFMAGPKETIVKELDLIRRRNPDGDGKLAVIGKEEIKQKHGFSPDYADAIMLRMFFELRPNYGKYAVI
jgi:hypothetical protein